MTAGKPKAARLSGSTDIAEQEALPSSLPGRQESAFATGAVRWILQAWAVGVPWEWVGALG